MTAMAKNVTIIQRALWMGFFRVTISREATMATSAAMIKMIPLKLTISIRSILLPVRSLSFVSRKSFLS